MPVVRSVALDASTYADTASQSVATNSQATGISSPATGTASTVNRLAIVDNTHNPDAADFRYIVAQLNASAVAVTLDDFGGNYSLLLDVAPHLGAMVVNGLSWSSVNVTAMYNDTTQHSLPIVMNLLSNALYRMNGECAVFGAV